MAREPPLSPLTKRALVLGAVAAGAPALMACASAPLTHDVPAVITGPTADGRAELARVVSQALRGAAVTLADDALTRDNVLIIQRARARGPDGLPLTGRDYGRPERFRLILEDSRCVLVHEGTGERLVLAAVRCTPR